MSSRSKKRRYSRSKRRRYSSRSRSKSPQPSYYLYYRKHSYLRSHSKSRNRSRSRSRSYSSSYDTYRYYDKHRNNRASHKISSKSRCRSRSRSRSSSHKKYRRSTRRPNRYRRSNRYSSSESRTSDTKTISNHNNLSTNLMKINCNIATSTTKKRNIKTDTLQCELQNFIDNTKHKNPLKLLDKYNQFDTLLFNMFKQIDTSLSLIGTKFKNIVIFGDYLWFQKQIDGKNIYSYYKINFTETNEWKEFMISKESNLLLEWT
eukprot:403148_1